MIQSLRKGFATVELSHQYGSGSIGAMAVEIGLVANHATFRAQLNPVGCHEKSDAEDLLGGKNFSLRSISFVDHQIRERTESFLRTHGSEIRSIQLEIRYGQVYKFDVSLDRRTRDQLVFNIEDLNF